MKKALVRSLATAIILQIRYDRANYVQTKPIGLYSTAVIVGYRQKTKDFVKVRL